MPTPNPIRRAALNLLARRDHSAHELAQKLTTKGYSAEEITPVIENLLKAALVDDMRFTESYIRWRRAKGYGPKRLIQELKAKGISLDTIAEQIHIADNAWFTEARNIWRKHFKGTLPADDKSRAKQIRFLLYRGYAQEHIEDILKK